MRRTLVGLSAVVAVVCLSATPAAAAYPPEDTAPTATAVDSGGQGQGSGSGAIPRTGSDSGDLLRVGAITGGVGVALVTVAGVRRRTRRVA